MGKKCYKILSLWIGLTKQETICFICMFWYCWIQTSPTGDHPYSDTSPLPTASVVCSIFLPHLRICCSIWQRTIIFWRIRVSPNFLLTALHVTQVDWLNCVVTKIWELILHHQIYHNWRNQPFGRHVFAQSTLCVFLIIISRRPHATWNVTLWFVLDLTHNIQELPLEAEKQQFTTLFVCISLYNVLPKFITLDLSTVLNSGWNMIATGLGINFALW